MNIKKGMRLRSYRTGVLREVAGFTTKPDGIRRARLQNVSPFAGRLGETKVKVDQIGKQYQLA